MWQLDDVQYARQCGSYLFSQALCRLIMQFSASYNGVLTLTQTTFFEISFSNHQHSTGMLFEEGLGRTVRIGVK